MKDKSSIVRMRALEVLREICLNKEVCIYLKAKGIFDLTFMMYEKSQNDILERTNIIEIFKDLF